MNFYVYKHIRQDNNLPFYIGKGKNKRAFDGKSQRNNFWANLVKKCGGFKVEFIAQNLDEELAFLCEIEAIDIYRKRGYKLVNLTDGGEGGSGRTYVMLEETKKKLSQKAIGRTGTFKSEHFTDEMRLKIAESNKRRKGIPTGKTAFQGKHHTEEHKEYMRQKMKGRVFSEETRKKMSDAQKRRFAK